MFVWLRGDCRSNRKESSAASDVYKIQVVDSGSFRFPIHAKHDEATIKIKSSSALPAKLLAAEFESFVTPRSRRYGS